MNVIMLGVLMSISAKVTDNVMENVIIPSVVMSNIVIMNVE